ncbi:MAG: response regulator transcription factor [Phycisphaerae bacterium]
MMSLTSTIRVEVADDHIVFREGLVAQINNQPDMIVVAVAGDAETALCEAVASKADILLFDIEMPGTDAFTATSDLAERHSPVRIIFLSAFSYDTYIERAIRAKAWGYISKSEPFSTVCDAIREVKAGWVYYSSEIRARILNTPDGLRLRRSAWDGATTRASQLTTRELELLAYLASGSSTKQIAQTMHISAKTVDSHKSSLMHKLDIHDRVGLARFAFREGIATP